MTVVNAQEKVLRSDVQFLGHEASEAFVVD